MSTLTLALIPEHRCEPAETGMCGELPLPLSPSLCLSLSASLSLCLSLCLSLAQSLTLRRGEVIKEEHTLAQTNTHIPSNKSNLPKRRYLLNIHYILGPVGSDNELGNGFKLI